MRRSPPCRSGERGPQLRAHGRLHRDGKAVGLQAWTAPTAAASTGPGSSVPNLLRGLRRSHARGEESRHEVRSVAPARRHDDPSRVHLRESRKIGAEALNSRFGFQLDQVIQAVPLDSHGSTLSARVSAIGGTVWCDASPGKSSSINAPSLRATRVSVVVWKLIASVDAAPTPNSTCAAASVPCPHNVNSVCAVNHRNPKCSPSLPHKGSCGQVELGGDGLHPCRVWRCVQQTHRRRIVPKWAIGKGVNVDDSRHTHILLRNGAISIETPPPRLRPGMFDVAGADARRLVASTRTSAQL